MSLCTLHSQAGLKSDMNALKDLCSHTFTACSMLNNNIYEYCAFESQHGIKVIAYQ